MTGPFVNELRAAPGVIRVGGEGDSALHLRVQAEELWDAVRVDAAPTETVASVKLAALEFFFPLGPKADDYMVKLHGYEVLSEVSSLALAGVKDGSTLLLSRRRRRPVR